MGGISLPALTHSPTLAQDEVAEHVVHQQPGARVSSDFATFPSALFVKVTPPRQTSPTKPAPSHLSHSLTQLLLVLQAREERQGDPVLVGRVMVSCPRGHEQVHRLVLPHTQLQRVHNLLRT